MPNAAQMLREDHKKVREMFRQFEELEDAEAKKAVADAAIVELTIHAMLEEEIFYPAVRQRGLDEETMDEAVEEHHVAETLMEELTQMAPGNSRFDAKFTVLAENVLHHIEEEESEMLPKAERMGQSLMSELGSKMEARRAQLIKSNVERARANQGGSMRSKASSGTSRSRAGKSRR